MSEYTLGLRLQNGSPNKTTGYLGELRVVEPKYVDSELSGFNIRGQQRLPTWGKYRSDLYKVLKRRD